MKFRIDTSGPAIQAREVAEGDVINNATYKTSGKVLALLHAIEMDQVAYLEMKQYLLQVAGVDLDIILVDTKIPNILPVEEFDKNILKRMWSILNKFIIDSIPHQKDINDCIFADFTVVTLAQKYVLGEMINWKSKSSFNHFCKHFQSTINLLLFPYPNVFAHLDEIIDVYPLFIDAIDNIQHAIKSLPDYDGLWKEDSPLNTYPNFSHISRIALEKMSRNPDSIIHGFTNTDTKTASKIFFLAYELIKYLYTNNDSNEERSPKDIVALSAFFYLIKLIGNEADRKNISQLEARKIVFGIDISNRAYTNLCDSKLFQDYIKEQSLSPEINRFLAKVALSQPSIFISSDNFKFEKLFLFLSGIQDSHRQQKIIGFVSHISTLENWNDEDITLMISEKLEDLPYINEIISSDIIFLNSLLARADKEKISTILCSISYHDFKGIQAIKGDPFSNSFFEYFFTSHEQATTVIKYMNIVGPLKEELSYIPIYFKGIHDRASEIIDIGNQPYMRDIQDILKCIAEIQGDPEFILLKNTHVTLCKKYGSPNKQEIINIVHIIYSSLKNKSIVDKTQFILGLTCLTLDEIKQFAHHIQGQDISDFDMYQIPEDNRFAFIIFVKENNYWDDIPTAVILFMEETNKEVGKTPDIYQQLNHIFGDKIWGEIKDIGFPDSTWSGIKQLSLELPGEWMIQIFGLFLKENRQKLQDKQHEDSQRLDRKFGHLERIIILLLSMGIQVIQKPEKLFEHVLLGDIRHQHVEYLCEIFSIYEYENDIETEYDKIIKTIIKYLKDRDESIITRFLGRKEIEIPDDEFSKDDTKDDIGKKRKKRRGCYKKEYTKGGLKVKHTAQHSKIHDTITQASFAGDTAFLDICEEILNGPEKYDKETYANIIINWHNLEGNYDERLLTKAIIELKLRPGELSLETMCKLFQSISKGVYDNSQVGNILNTCKLTIAGSVFDHIGESDASNLIYALSFLREFHQAQGILETFINRNKIIGISFDTPISIHHTLYGLFEYRDTLCAKKLIIKLFEAAVKLDSFSNINAKGFAQVFNIYDRPTPPALDFALKHAITHTLPPNRGEENTAKLFGRYFHKVLTGQYIGGFECDIILPEQKVNIEFDGVQYHEGWDRERGEIRDAYLEKNGWKVYRIRSDEDINRRVHEIVAEISKNRA